MTNHSEVNIRKNQSKEKVNEDKNSGMRESETLADFAARKLGIKKGKLPEDWCRVIFKR